MRTVAVVLAGGSGVRLGGNTPQQPRLLGRRALLEQRVATCDAARGTDEIRVVMPADLIDTAKQLLDAQYGKVSHIIPGGIDRPGSTRQAIDLLTRMASDDGSQRQGECNVLFHDA